jgi:hypothetical protein
MELQPEMSTSVFSKLMAVRARAVYVDTLQYSPLKGRSSSKSDFRTVKLMLLLLLLSVEHEKICCSNSLISIVACFL